ncbi:MAG: dienelactone hydrolase family protein [Pseudomonadota bacterium]|nr:dienelactone hydrolase family protein [Pseudomonadota bacterium]
MTGRMAACLALLLVLLGGLLQHAGAAGRETLSFDRIHRGKPLRVSGELLLPDGAGPFPAMVIQHGSGGVSQAREYRYAAAFVGMGVAALVVDSFGPRGVGSTVSDQSSVSIIEMVHDDLAALGVLAADPRIDPAHIGIVGFSKGGSAVLGTALKRQADRFLPGGPRFALHVAFYPACNNHYRDPAGNGAPVIMLLGGDDTYAGLEPCTEYAEMLRAAGVPLTVRTYPGARHGFDGERAYSLAGGENWSACVFEEQADGSWRERSSGATTFNADGTRNREGVARAIAACRRLGVSGGPDPAARDASMTELTAAIRRHLPGGE